MRGLLTSVILIAVGVVPAYAGAQMKQSPVLAHKAGAACRSGHPGPQRGAGYGYRLGGCVRPAR